MIRINLLPEGSRRSAGIRAMILPWRQIGVAAGALLGLISLWLAGANFFQTQSLQRLTAELESLGPEKARWEEMKSTLAVLQTRAKILQSLKSPQMQWSRRLNLLSDALVADLWFTTLVMKGVPSSEMKDFLSGEFSGIASEMGISEPDLTSGGPPGTSRRLVFLRGSALVTSKEAAAPVSRFLQKLKEHPEFSQWFSTVELKDVAHYQVGQEEVSDFAIVLTPTGE